MFEIGRVCMKIAGRDAGKICVVIEKIGDKYVLIDGQTRRRKCNINHLELLDKVVKLDKKASNSDVVRALKGINVECEEKKAKEKKQSKERPKKQKKVKKEEIKESKEVKKKLKAKKEEKKDKKGLDEKISKETPKESSKNKKKT